MSKLKNMVHLNGHVLCAIDLETTGLRAGYHEICQVAIVPLDANLNIRQDVPIYEQYIRPRYPDRIDSGAVMVSKNVVAKAMEVGHDAEIAQDLFEYWYAKLNLPLEKRIIPLGSNYGYDRDFMQAWLGGENYNFYFDSRCRDLMIVAAYLNDRSDFQGEQTPFNKSTLPFIARKIGIEVDPEQSHDAMYDAWLTAQCYKKLCIEELI